MSKKPSSRNSMLSALMTGAVAAPEQKTAPENTTSVVSAPVREEHGTQPRVSAGAVGALKNTLAHITKDGRVVELDPAFIQPSPYPDRMDGAESEEAIEVLAKSIAKSGQEVPVLVRPHPTLANHYQTIYGHRRIRAIARIGDGLKVRAIIRELTDGELLLAQGIENSARQDLSWIEKAMFARQLETFARDNGRDPTALVMEALSLHPPDVSRFRTTLEVIPDDIVVAIGAAPKIGRTKWLKLYNVVKDDPSSIDRMRRLKSMRTFHNRTSDERFSEMLRSASDKGANGGIDGGSQLVGSNGEALGTVERKRSSTRINLTDRAFALFVEERLVDLHQEFQARAR
ncbi:plasmid partitioning protein RepB [Rhizobiaceae bacterium n13]|uniref:Plasmid partitioning protein RepB n=1 Tax=Ferirhizobium litorale TaxID=2927786 RepID=A0AAE3U360_9HYPH|nr:plasmid partitioning protein RepB [Fererhizobium litorale]MDI7861895.1 plasmid partitioning protein RepB [Fererhizobium litorale]MDI7921764.1 plasmid partitioning protein RepB [Fererhizobium litorale]